MKQCDTCGHTNGRLRQSTGYLTGQPIPGRYRCSSVRACIRRMEQLGQWVGKRVLHRIDADGTEWIIRLNSDYSEFGGATLTMVYREHRCTSRHDDVEAAKAHVDDLIASWRARSLKDYDATVIVPQPDCQDEELPL